MKYSMSAIPGNPLKEGGKVFLTCLEVSRAISTFSPLVTRLVRILLVAVHELLKGNYSKSVKPPSQVQNQIADLEIEWVFVRSRRKGVRGCW